LVHRGVPYPASVWCNILARDDRAWCDQEAGAVAGLVYGMSFAGVMIRERKAFKAFGA
jgi:hypothetical protein